MQSGERLGWFFLLIPIAGFFMAEVVHSFVARYLIAALPGIALALSCCLWRHFRATRYVSLGVVLILLMCGLAKQVVRVRHPEAGYYSPIRQILAQEDPLRKDGKQIFAFFNLARYVEAVHYSQASGKLQVSLLPGAL